jgi:hypothetical protein
MILANSNVVYLPLSSTEPVTYATHNILNTNKRKRSTYALLDILSLAAPSVDIQETHACSEHQGGGPYDIFSGANYAGKAPIESQCL